MKRQEIEAKRQENSEKIKALKMENIELAIKDMLLCDETQRYEEKEEEVIISRRPKKVEKQLIGRVYWKEDFEDTDSGDYVTIERQQIVRINGEWQ